jgi:hypothetical protein
VDDDPFAKLDLDTDGPGRAAAPLPLPPPAPPAGVDTERAPRSAAAATPAAPPPRRSRGGGGEGLAASLGSWALLLAAAGAAAFGLAVAGWTSGALDLDARWMPTAERSLGVRPPVSFLAENGASADDVRQAAKAAETRGDWPAAVVQWRRLQAIDPEDKAAVAGLPRALTALGETLR